jgi:hypothetical protein
MISIPASAVLSTVLDQGRAEFSGPGRDIVKIQVGEGEVRGGGRLVLRRTTGMTSASVLAGAFRVRAVGRTVELKAGQATVVMDGRAPLPASPLPAPPRSSSPAGTRCTCAPAGPWSCAGPPRARPITSSCSG